MKKIVAIVFSAAALLLGTAVAHAQLSFGAGWLNSTEITKYTNGDPDDKTNLNGLYLGGQYNLNLVAGLFADLNTCAGSILQLTQGVLECIGTCDGA